MIATKFWHALETLRRVDDAERRRRFEEQLALRFWIDIGCEDALVRWRRLRQQSVEPPKPAPSPPKQRNMTDTQIRAHVDEQLEDFAKILGEEVAVIEKKIRADFNVEIAELRAQLYELRHGERSTDVLELPDWRHAATH